METPTPLDKPNVVDHITRGAVDEIVTLHLVATEPWDPKGETALKLEAKLENYIAFAADGQLLSRYPELKGKKIGILIETKHPLGDREQKLVEIVRRGWCEPSGISLDVKVG